MSSTAAIPPSSLAGIGASSGIGIGRAFVHRVEKPVAARRRLMHSRVEMEVDRFLNSLYQVGEEIRRTRRLVELEHGPELARIFDVQLAMLADEKVKDQTVTRIRQELCPAETAFANTMEGHKRAFEENEYLRARVGDVRDIEHQVLVRLAGGELGGLQSIRANTIVVARDLLPSEAVQLGRRLIKGLVTEQGAATSHTSIIARSLGLPTVVGVESACSAIASGDNLVVDADEGVVHIRPKIDTLRYYKTALRRQRQRERDLRQRRDLPAVTLDGTEITLMANVDLPQEIEAAIDNGARGVGMFRTEFLYLGYRLPTEQDQLNAYRKIAESVAPMPAVIRTLDLGGDKLTHVLDTAHEANPFLGWRGIRICLDNPDLFKTQLRALLRAGLHGDIQILLPMVGSVEEIRRARAVIEETKADLRREGTPFGEACKLGIMIEVPSAAILVDQMAAEADFLSLGTNDLTQYTLAVDRGSAKVAHLYDPFHPAVLTLIKAVADAGLRAGIPTSICGEMAGDPTAIPLLLGLGVRILSLSPGLIPEVKEVVRVLELDHARELASRCLELESGSAVRGYVATGAYRGD
jgi:phosphotransferase system enzyme I (PtsI)